MAHIVLKAGRLRAGISCKGMLGEGEIGKGGTNCVN